jgi:hypothetical protein
MVAIFASHGERKVAPAEGTLTLAQMEGTGFDDGGLQMTPDERIDCVRELLEQLQQTLLGSAHWRLKSA